MSAEPESPYLLAPGPERRALMREMGIPVYPLDYTDAEWATREAAPSPTDKPPRTSSGDAESGARFG